MPVRTIRPAWHRSRRDCARCRTRASPAACCKTGSTARFRSRDCSSTTCQTDQLFAAARDWKQAAEPSGTAAKQRREHLLDINAYVTGNRLHVAWTSRACHDADTIRRVAQAYVAALETLVAGHAVPSASSRPATGLPQAPASVRPDEIADVYPLTPTQQGMLFHSLYAPASDAYFSSLNFRIDGALDVERFRRAWETVAHRHDILRTAFHWGRHREPVQVASPDRLAVARRGSARGVRRGRPSSAGKPTWRRTGRAASTLPARR